MKLLDSVALILKQKGSEVHSINPDVTVYEALERMADKDIGALVVMDGTDLVGLISERDYVRKVILKGQSSKEMKVHEVMTSPALTVDLRTTVDECMHRMTDERCRHLAVVEEGRVVGVVSIGDLVNWIITAQDFTIHQLQDYICGNYNAKMPLLAGQTAFYYLAAASVASAILAVTRRNPIHSMLWVLALFLHVAGIFVLVGAEFLAAVQVIVYAGAILVFYLFFLMLLDLPTEAAGPRFSVHWPLCVAAGLIFAALTSYASVPGLVPTPPHPAAEGPPPGNLAAVGMALFTEFALPFEIASLVLLAAIVGAVVVAKRKTDS